PDQPRRVAQIVGRREVVVKADRIREITDPPLDRKRLPRRIKSEHADLAGGNFRQAEHHQNCSRLAGAIGPKQAKNLAASHPKRNVIDGEGRPIAFGEAISLDHGIGDHRRPNLATAPTITKSATPMMPTPAIPHMVDVVTVTRKLVDADSPRAEARMVV